MLAVNLGGEGEVPGVLNQQGRWVVLNPGWRASRTPNTTFADLVRKGYDFIIADNDRLPFPDEMFDEVFTNNVPIDRPGLLGPGIPTSEIMRILKPGGRWVRDLGEPTEQIIVKT